MYGDPQRVYALAQHVEDKEQAVRAQAHALRQQAAATHWESIAAQVHRDHVAHDARLLEHGADRLREVVLDLRRHAAHMQHVIDEIHAAEEHVRRWFQHAERSFTQALVHAGEAVVDFFRHPSAPWAHWPWHPDRLPTSGHLDWLDALHLTRTSAWQP